MNAAHPDYSPARAVPVDAASVPSLYGAEFAAFCQAAHGIVPYPWQLRVAQHVFETRRWPRALSLPCGVGRCVLADIAIFHLALEADDSDRQAALRITQILDRWTIENSFFDHAMHLAKRLHRALESNDQDHVLTRVARRLAFLAGCNTPLLVRRIAETAPLEGDWTLSAHQPTVVCSLIDAIGSRLLFRAYGASASMQSLHAGLFGADCLYLLDDTRSEAFRQTLLAVDRLRREPWSLCACAPWTAVDVRVRRSYDTGEIALSHEDRQNAELGRRLRSAKPTHLRLLKSRSTRLASHAEEIVNHAWLCSEVESGIRGRKICIVVNTIGLARECASALESRLTKYERVKSALLIGRSRPIERDVLRELRPIIKADREEDPTFFLVATQCIEAGPDYDFDILVSQIASVDALQSRFARLDRRALSSCAQGSILACPDEVKASARDPIYGTAASATWRWLLQLSQHDTSDSAKGMQDGTRGVLDFGADAIEQQLLSVDADELVRPTADAPILMPAYLELLSQTSPVPATAPSLELFLHGAPDAGDVQILWRADADLDRRALVDQTRAVLEAMPPRPQEILAIPLCVARAWLRQAPPLPVSDLQGVPPRQQGPAETRPAQIGRPVLRWAGPHEHTRRIYAHALRPGDLIVVPSEYGGVDRNGWCATSRERTDSLESLLAAEGSASRALRLHPALLQDGEECSAESIWHSVWQTFIRAEDRTDGAAVARLLARLPHLPNNWLKRLRLLSRSKSVAVTAASNDEDVLVGGLLLIDLDDSHTQSSAAVQVSQVSTTERGEPPFVVPPVTLQTYAQRFEARAIDAAKVVFPASVAADIVLAARLSVLGHRDSRYQAYLRGGDRMAYEFALEALASPTVLFDSNESQEARERVELPNRWCAQIESVRLAALDSRLESARDKLLVLWLIGTLSGTGRPHLLHRDPLYSGPWNFYVRTEGYDWADLLRLLNRRYGWWGLAHLESILRLSEHRTWYDVKYDEEARPFAVNQSPASDRSNPPCI